MSRDPVEDGYRQWHFKLMNTFGVVSTKEQISILSESGKVIDVDDK